MERYDLYKDISTRTGGDIYLGVVGPVRTGKSTFIKSFMKNLVIPNIDNFHERERARDELPQSGTGKTIMTTEPKFIPNEAVSITFDDSNSLNVRLVDCVGFMINGAIGDLEEGLPRMITTPWDNKEIPFEDAAEIGTKKVINQHSTIGIVVFTDGSITGFNRDDYLDAEEKTIEELNQTNKPYVIVLNTLNPFDPSVRDLANELEKKYQTPVIPVDCLNMTRADIDNILTETLDEFSISEININIPEWIEGLSDEHWLKKNIYKKIETSLEGIEKIKDINKFSELMSELEDVNNSYIKHVDLATGNALLDIELKEHLFFDILEQITGYRINGEYELMSLLKSLSSAKKEYDKIEEALVSARTLGYGVVPPEIDDLFIEKPELYKQGGKYGVKIKADAPTLHIMRADIKAEVAPLVGTEKQSEDLLEYLKEEFDKKPEEIWNTNLFGKTLYELVKEQFNGKLHTMPLEVQSSLQKILQDLVNNKNKRLLFAII